MTSLAYTEYDGPFVRDVHVDEAHVTFELADGRVISAPLDWYPRLKKGTAEQRGRWRLIGGGEGVHWPDVDEDISAEGMLAGGAAPPGSADWRSPMLES